jgi:hypothetical protein
MEYVPVASSTSVCTPATCVCDALAERTRTSATATAVAERVANLQIISSSSIRTRLSRRVV